MSLYQNSVIKKYLKSLETVKVDEAWQKFTIHFHNKAIQENIRNSKEEQYQGEFLIDLFVNVFGYVKNPNPNFNLTTELKNVKGAKKTDGAIINPMGLNPLENPLKVHAVIELKGTNTTDLSKIETQAFGYKNNQPGCVYVITSNFEKLRFYIDNAVDFEEFNLFQLTRERFNVLWLCLSSEYLLKNTPKQIKDESLTEEEEVTKNLYKDYSLFRNELFASIQKNNPQYDKLTLFKKTQKLLDRFLFIFFAEDRLLLPPNSIREIVKQWTILRDELDEYVPLYSRFKKYFGYMNTGYKGKKHDIFAYNGGLFASDNILDNIKIDDTLLYTHTQKLSNYDFESEVSVNILGHIFEHSLNEIEEIQAELEGIVTDKSKSKRKKDGVFYTPKYITKYIVDNTVGKLCEEKKTELGIDEAEYEKDRKRRKKTTLKSLIQKLEDYRTWLLKLTICDPACGSGAFLNQALEFLISEHRYIDELNAKLLGEAMVLSEVENTILENNLFGVDINQESVEIAKLSLWLRTAQKGRKLTTLNNNIKCGNSLIDDPEVASDKAFNWQREFPQVFRSKDKQAFHVVLTTHNSRTSQRMIKYNVKKGPPIELNLEEEIALTNIIGDIIKDNQYNCLAYNICKDHVHLIFVCEHEELTGIVQKLKSVSSKKFHRLNIPMGHDPLKHGNHFWSQKFFRADLDVWKLATLSKKPGYIYQDTHLDNAILYIQNNRQKHQLPESNALQNIINDFVVDQDVAFNLEYSGGFDVVIGNPPYGASLSPDEKSWFKKNYEITQGIFDTYLFFFEKTFKILRPNGITGVITPNTFLVIENANLLRNFLYSRMKVISFLEVFNVFADAVVEPIVSIFQKDIVEKEHSFIVKLIPRGRKVVDDINHSTTDTFFTLKEIYENEKLVFNYRIKKKEKKLLKKLLNLGKTLGEITTVKAGVKPYEKGKGTPPQTVEIVKEKPFNGYKQLNEDWRKVIRGTDVTRHGLNWAGEYIKYGKWLAAPRSESMFTTPKIFMRRTDDKLMVSTDLMGMVGVNSVHCIQLTENNIKQNLHELQALLNSKLLGWIFRTQNFHMVGKPLAEVKVVFVKRLPFLKPKNSKISELVEVITEKQRTYSEKSFSFIQLIQSKYTLDKPNKKLKNWHELEFGIFLKELEKARKKAFSNSTSNGFKPIGLAESAEWMQYFNEQKAKVQSLQSDIEKTDRAIDQMVYELYGLTEEEIQIVETANT